jgi:sugar O-acyltransferase (sialic acid O-acetyltransferase NeuD family)
MKDKNIILVGAGGHAISCIDVIELQHQFKIVGLVDLPSQKSVQKFSYPVFDNPSSLDDFVGKCKYAHIAVGQIKPSSRRSSLYKKALELGFEMPSIISPLAYVSPGAIIGLGTIIMHGAIINSGVRIGKNCIINSRALIEHGVVIGDHSHISTGCILNGDVFIEDECFIGSGSCVKEGVKIERSSVVGMGLTVRYNLIENSIFVG